MRGVAGVAHEVSCTCGRVGSPVRSGRTSKKEGVVMWWTVGVLAVLWVLGLITGTTLGGWIHLLIAVAVVLALVKLFGGNKGKVRTS